MCDSSVLLTALYLCDPSQETYNRTTRMKVKNRRLSSCRWESHQPKVEGSIPVCFFLFLFCLFREYWCGLCRSNCTSFDAPVVRAYVCVRVCVPSNSLLEWCCLLCLLLDSLSPQICHSCATAGSYWVFKSFISLAGCGLPIGSLPLANVS